MSIGPSQYQLQAMTGALTPPAGTRSRETRENILGLVSAMNAGVPIPNPRPWFPKGHLTPIMISHADLVAIGAALLAKKDACYGVYFAHKTNIIALADPAAIQAYDVTQGYGYIG